MNINKNNLLLEERELELIMKVGGKTYTFDFDIKNIIDDHDMMPITIIENIEQLQIAVKDFNDDK